MGYLQISEVPMGLTPKEWDQIVHIYNETILMGRWIDMGEYGHYHAQSSVKALYIMLIRIWAIWGPTDLQFVPSTILVAWDATIVICFLLCCV
jgi:hypothetical protein